MTKISKSKYLKVTNYIVDEEYENTRLDNCLISKLKNLPRSKIYSIIRKGEVRINGSRSKPDRRLKKGDVIRIPPYRVEERGQNTASKSLTELLKDRIIYNKNSVLIFNKVPQKNAIEKSLIENWINKSIEKAKLNHIRGKDLTPFLIAEINILSKNRTLEANTALIINNALLAGKISKKFNLISSGPTNQRNFLIKLGILLRVEILMRNANSKQKKMLKNGLNFLINKNKMGKIFNVISISNKKINDLIGF